MRRQMRVRPTLTADVDGGRLADLAVADAGSAQAEALLAAQLPGHPGGTPRFAQPMPMPGGRPELLKCLDHSSTLDTIRSVCGRPDPGRTRFYPSSTIFVADYSLMRANPCRPRTSEAVKKSMLSFGFVAGPDFSRAVQVERELGFSPC